MAPDAAGPGRPGRAFLLALSVALASGVALAAWSATAGGVAERSDTVQRAPRLDRLLDEAQASPTQRALSHQIFDAAEATWRMQRDAERADGAQMAQLFSQPIVDPVEVEALRRRIEQRHDLASRRATQALIDVSLVLNVEQRRIIADRLADAPRAFAAFPHPPTAAVASY